MNSNNNEIRRECRMLLAVDFVCNFNAFFPLSVHAFSISFYLLLFLPLLQEGTENDVDQFLRRKFENRIVSIERVMKVR